MKKQPNTSLIKGIKNETGDNNCFLNSIVQNLYHLKSFRHQFLNINHPIHPTQECVFCALRNLFERYTSESDLTPRDLRLSLSGKEERFKLGESEDATEVYEVLLDSLHNCFNNLVTCEPPCIIHKMFSLKIVEYYECHRCGEKKDAIRYSKWIHYIPAESLLELYQRSKDNLFSHLIGKTNHNDSRPCEKCNSHLVLKRKLLNLPDVISMTLSFSKSNPMLQELTDLVDAIDTHINTKDMFDQAMSCVYSLSAMLCYSAMHYISIVKVGRNWIKFDDLSCKVIGASWESVSLYLKKGHLQCHTLVYEKLSIKT